MQISQMTMRTKTMRKIKSYSELIKLKTYDERLRYLCEANKVGESTFGHNRYLNQAFYHSAEWRRCRRQIINRDLGCDMGLEGWDIHGRIIVHHINPLTLEDVDEGSDRLFDPENLICVSHNTHELITYGLANYRPIEHIERRPNDTCPWRHN